MTGFLLRRLGHAFTVVLVVCTVTFGIIHLAPGGPALLADPKLSLEERTAIERRLGLDQPLPVQYGRWLGRAARGDLGESFLYQTPNVAAITARLPRTALLAGTALALSICLAIPLGVRCAARPRGLLDRVVSGVALVAMAVPTFWLAIGAIFVFAVAWVCNPYPHDIWGRLNLYALVTIYFITISQFSMLGLPKEGLVVPRRFQLQRVASQKRLNLLHLGQRFALPLGASLRDLLHHHPPCP